MDTIEKPNPHWRQDLKVFSGHTGGKAGSDYKTGKKNPALSGARLPVAYAGEGMVVLDPFGCTDNRGGIHAAKKTGKLLRKLHTLF